LKSVKAESGFEDLSPLKNVLKDVQIVGLGEATHGTKEFFQMKHRMLEFLVKEMGFTVLALEFNYIGKTISMIIFFMAKGMLTLL